MALKARISPAHLVDGLALDCGGHHRRRGLADGTTLPADLEVGHDALVVDVQVEHDLVAAQRVEAFDAMGGGNLQLAAVAGAAVVVEDDLAVEVFEVGHGGLLQS